MCIFVLVHCSNINQVCFHQWSRLPFLSYKVWSLFALASSGWSICRGRWGASFQIMSGRDGSILTTPGLMSAFFKQHLDPWKVFFGNGFQISFYRSYVRSVCHLFHLSDRDYGSYILNLNTTVIKSIAVQLFLHWFEILILVFFNIYLAIGMEFLKQINIFVKLINEFWDASLNMRSTKTKLDW